MSLYRVNWRDGSKTENVSYDESMELLKQRPEDWASVQFMENGRDLNVENEKLRKQAWGARKKK